MDIECRSFKNYGAFFMNEQSQYTCQDYRQEMVLVGLRRQLEKEDLSEPQRQEILQEIKRMEKSMGMD
jgi:hypothetical protein